MTEGLILAVKSKVALSLHHLRWSPSLNATHQRRQDGSCQHSSHSELLMTEGLFCELINIFTDTTKVFMYFRIWCSDNCQSVFFKKSSSFFIVLFSILGIMPRTLHSKNPQYTFREPFAVKSEWDIGAKNHTKDSFLLWSYSFAAFLRSEQCLCYVFSALQSLRHASRATSLYTREACSERNLFFSAN